MCERGFGGWGGGNRQTTPPSSFSCTFPFRGKLFCFVLFYLVCVCVPLCVGIYIVQASRAGPG